MIHGQFSLLKECNATSQSKRTVGGIFLVKIQSPCHRRDKRIFIGHLDPSFPWSRPLYIRRKKLDVLDMSLLHPGGNRLVDSITSIWSRCHGLLHQTSCSQNAEWMSQQANKALLLVLLRRNSKCSRVTAQINVAGERTSSHRSASQQASDESKFTTRHQG
jgi:hypothetical protein